MIYTKIKCRLEWTTALSLLTDWLTDWLWRTGWLTDWLTNWLTNWLTDWLTNSLQVVDWLYWMTDGLTDWRTEGLTDWRTDGQTDWRTDGLTDWRADGLTGWRADGLTDWRTDGLTDSRTGSPINIWTAPTSYKLCRRYIGCFSWQGGETTCSIEALNGWPVKPTCSLEYGNLEGLLYKFTSKTRRLFTGADISIEPERLDVF